MSLRILISHDDADMEAADDLATLFGAAFSEAEVVTSALPQESSTPNAATWFRQELARADIVAALLTRASASTQEVAFQLGAGWALGKRLTLVVPPDEAAAGSWWTLCESAPVPRTSTALVDLLATLASEFGVVAHYGPATTAALEQLCGALDTHLPNASSNSLPKGVGASAPAPDAPSAPGTPQAPVTATASDAPIAPPDAPVPDAPDTPAASARPGLPSCAASLDAGRAFSDCVFNRESGADFARELDAPFGGFLSLLGGSWATLRDIGDLEVWMEAADNLLEHLTPAEDHVRAWYEIGFQLQTMRNVIEQFSDADPDERAELSQMWKDAWTELKTSAGEAGFDSNDLKTLEHMLENLRGPEAQRDYTFMARIQELVRGRAERTDAAGAVG